jgi:hypothetical protein
MCGYRELYEVLDLMGTRMPGCHSANASSIPARLLWLPVDFQGPPQDLSVANRTCPSNLLARYDLCGPVRELSVSLVSARSHSF